MSKFKKILVPVDFSDVSAKALKVALELASDMDAEITVLHAVSMSAVSLPVDGVPVFNDEMIEEELGQAKKSLSEFLKDKKGKAKITEVVCFGEPTSEVNNYSDENKSDMIVMGTHGRTGLFHLLMGSVAESVLRDATVPVLCVPAK